MTDDSIGPSAVIMATDGSPAQFKNGVYANGYQSNNSGSSAASQIEDLLTWKMISSIGPGFDNRGNTCFLNSVLQCLVYTPPLANYFIKHNHRSQCNINGFCAACSISDLIRTCVSSNKTKRSSITPNAFTSKLHNIAKTMKFGRQEDSHEFLRFLIEAISKGFSKNGESSASNPIELIFGFKLQSTVTCFSCKKSSHAKDPAMDLNLDLKGCDSIEKAISLFSRKEMLSGRNKYKCENCKKLSDASKQMSITEPPNVLCVQLKRFEFTAFGQKKISKFISYPEHLTLPYHDLNSKKMSEKKYQLYGVLVHAGHTSRSGHYYAFVKAPNGIWYCMDDSNVNQVKQSKVLQQNAYLLFYVAVPDNSSRRPSELDRVKATMSNGIPPSPPASPHIPIQNNANPVTPVQNGHMSSSSSLSQSSSFKTSSNAPIKLSIDDIFNKKRKKPKMNTDEIETPSKPAVTATLQSRPQVNENDAVDKVVEKLKYLGKGTTLKKEDYDKEDLSDSDYETPEQNHTKPVSNSDTAVVIKYDETSIPSIDLEQEVKQQDIVNIGRNSSKSKRPRRYDLEYDEGKKKKNKKKHKAWSVFELSSNPFSKAQDRINKEKKKMKRI